MQIAPHTPPSIVTACTKMSGERNRDGQSDVRYYIEMEQIGYDPGQSRMKKWVWFMRNVKCSFLDRVPVKDIRKHIESHV